MTTESSSKSSCSLNNGLTKKKHRKIRCTQEFNDLDRESIFSVPSNGESTKKSKTKKKTNIQFLPQIKLNMDIPTTATDKENLIINGNSPTDGILWTKPKKMRKQKDDLSNKETTRRKSKEHKKCSSSTSELSDLAKEIDNMDCEVVFKYKKKLKKSKNRLEGLDGDGILTNKGKIENEEVVHDTRKSVSNQEHRSMKNGRKPMLRKKSGLRQGNFDIANCEIPSGNIYIEDISSLEDNIELCNDQGRKSVRFVSPSKESVTNRRSTFDVQENTTDISVLKSFHIHEKSSHIEKNATKLNSSAGIDIHDSSLEKADSNRDNAKWSSPSVLGNDVIINYVTQILSKTPNGRKSNLVSENSSQKSHHDSRNIIEAHCVLKDHPRESEMLVERSFKTVNADEWDSINLNHTQNESITKSVHEVKRICQKSVSGRRSTFEMPSPIFGPEKYESKTKGNDSTNDSMKQKSLQPKISIIDLITPTASSEKQKIDDSVKLVKSHAKKMIRESTFTRYEKMCERIDETKVSSPEKLAHTKDEIVSNEQIGNSLKKKNRRTWNKSLGVSFLDNSGNLQNITAPWTREVKDVLIQDKETPKGNKAMLIEKAENSLSKVAKTPPSGTSTPLPADKKHSLRAALLKDCHVRINETKNTTLMVHKPKKMPNFAVIHQRAYDKMENVQEMSERKASRAKLLLSGQKPTLESSCKRKSPKKNKKLLQYSPRIATTQTTPKLASNSVTKVKALTPSTSNLKVLPKLKEYSKVRSYIPKLRSTNKIVGVQQNLKKVEMNVAVKNKNKEEQVKAFVNKTKVPSCNVEQRRTDMKNVRTNRRFELLMKMRNQSKH